MRATIALVGALMFLGCEPAPQGDTGPIIPICIADSSQPLTSGANDELFTIRYADEGDAGLDDTGMHPVFPVSGMRADIQMGSLHKANFWDLRYQLIIDRNGDNRFGPGDVILVSENNINILEEKDVGTYRIALWYGEVGDQEVLGMGDWAAQ